MSDKCAGCTNKYKYFEKPSVCPQCRRSFCQSCLPYTGVKVKKGQAQVALEICTYCSRQKSANEAEEKEIMSNFQERYYKRTHIEPPIQSSLRLDKVMGSNAGNTSPKGSPRAVHLTEEDRKLEERLRKLKESHKPTGPSYTEDELKDRLDNLRGESSHSGSDGKSEESSSSTLVASKGGSVATDETERLMQKSEDEVRLDSKLDSDSNTTDDNLRRRQENLKGNSAMGKVSLQFDVNDLVSGLDDSISFEDTPEKLLQDLLAFQAKQSKTAGKEGMASEDIQSLLDKAQELAKQEKQRNYPSQEEAEEVAITYPQFPEDISGPGDVSDRPSQEQIDQMIKEGKAENWREQDEERKLNQFIEQSSDRLAKIRKASEHSLPDDEVVKSKPVPATTDSNLDFTWGHFGGSSSPRPSSSSHHPPGNTERFNDEVQDLIARMLDEAELDSRLEASGLDCQPRDSGSDNKSAATGGGKGGASAGAMGYTRPSDDLPWCCICNNDATMRCLDCDDDLYCQRCFSEGHQQFGLFDHRYKIFETHK